MCEEYNLKIKYKKDGHIFKTSIFKSRKSILENIAKIIGYDLKSQNIDLSVRDGSIVGYHDDSFKNRSIEGFSNKKICNSYTNISM